MRIRRSPPSLRGIFAQVLATKPCMDLTGSGESTSEHYRAVIDVSKAQHQILMYLAEESYDRQPFVWEDPLDHVDKVLLFQAHPIVLNIHAVGRNQYRSVLIKLSWKKDATASDYEIAED